MPLARLIRPVLLGCLLAANLGVQAQGLAGPSAVPWASLNPTQREVLAPLERDWGSISGAQQQKWLEVANRDAARSPGERARLRQRMTEWSRLPAQERARARMNFQEVRQLSPEERQSQWDAYRALPADQRRALADQAQARPAGRDRAPVAAIAPKSAVVPAPAITPPQPVGPTVVQRGSGATTNLVTRPTTPPLHQQAGLPKVAATPEFVDGSTLLPQRGAQAADTRPAKKDRSSRRGEAASGRADSEK